MTHANILVALVLATGFFSWSHSSVPDVYPRTTYTDDAFMPGAWYTNPAAIADIRVPLILTANALPLGDSLLISSIRVMGPLSPRLSICGGILGAGAYQTGTSQSYASSNGYSYQSHFAFSHPRFEAGCSWWFIHSGALGIVSSIGSDPVFDGYQSRNRISPGLGAGWLSPLLAKTLRLSLSGMWIYHRFDTPLWEKDGKIAMTFMLPDSLMSATVQMTFSLDGGFAVFTPRRESYEVLKTTLDMRLNQTISILAGYSIDTRWWYANGWLIHGGVRLRQNAQSPFFGGYEAGAHIGSQWRIIHRIWLGLDIASLRQLTVD